MDLFWVRGYAAVTVSDLADAMGVQRSSFYNSFGTREAVFLDALRRYGGESPDVGLDRLSPDAPVVPAQVGLLRTVCRVRAHDPRACGCLIFNSVAEVDTSDRRVRQVLSRMLARRTRVVQRLLRRAVDRGELARPGDVAAAARGYVTFLVGLNTLSRVVRSQSALWAACVEFLRGLGIEADDGEPRSPSSVVAGAPARRRRRAGSEVLRGRGTSRAR